MRKHSSSYIKGIISAAIFLTLSACQSALAAASPLYTGGCLSYDDNKVAHAGEIINGICRRLSMPSSYATQQNIIDRYGPELLLVIASVDGEQVDSEAVTQAVQDASAEIDTYLGAKYQLPFSTVPQVLPRLCVDIAIYRLASTNDTYAEEKRQRYDDAVKLLQRIAKGEAGLNIISSDPPQGGSSAEAGSAVVVSGPPRMFGRANRG